MDALTDFIVTHWVVVMQGVFIASLIVIVWVYLPILWGAPWIPGSFRVIHRMLELAEVKPGQMVIDLGAGDGRVVILAARKFKAKAIGGGDRPVPLDDRQPVDFDPGFARESGSPSGGYAAVPGRRSGRRHVVSIAGHAIKN